MCNRLCNYGWGQGQCLACHSEPLVSGRRRSGTSLIVTKGGDVVAGEVHLLNTILDILPEAGQRSEWMAL